MVSHWKHIEQSGRDRRKAGWQLGLGAQMKIRYRWQPEEHKEENDLGDNKQKYIKFVFNQ